MIRLRPRMPRISSAGWVTVAALLYFAAAFAFNVNVSTLLGDESVVAVAARGMYEHFFDYLFGPNAWPLAYSPYTGLFVAYPAVFFISLFGSAVWVIRIQYLFWVAGGALCMQSVLRRAFGRFTATAAAVMLLTDTYYIRSAVSGLIRDEVLMNALFWIALFFLLRSGGSKRARAWLFAAGLTMGMGLWAKIQFTGYLLGLSACLVVFRRDCRLAFADKFMAGARNKLILLGAFVLGYFPMILFNIRNSFPTLDLVAGLTRKGGGAWNNLALFGNLWVRLGDMFWLGAGLMVPESVKVFDIFPPAPDIVQGTVFIVALFWLAGRLFVRSDEASGFSAFTLRALTVIYACMLCGTCIIPGNYLREHVVILLPAVKILFALFVCRVFWDRGAWGWRAAALFLVCASIAMQVFNMGYFLRVVWDRGGTNEYSLSVQQEMVTEVRRQKTVVLADITDHYPQVWDFYAPERSQYTHYLREFIDVDEKPGNVYRVYHKYLSFQKRYLLLCKTFVSGPCFCPYLREMTARFFAILKEDEGRLTLIKSFYAPGGGREVYRLYEVDNTKRKRFSD